MNDIQKLKYFDNLFSSGGQIIKGEAIKWAKRNNVRFNDITVDDYFELLLQIAGSSKEELTARQWKEFKEELWKGVKWSPELLKVGQVLCLYNKNFTGNRYVITRLGRLGFDVYNRRLPQYRFNDLDYSSIDKILIFNL